MIRSALDGLLSDVYFVLRRLRKAPGFTGVAVATLGLGIGVTTSVFSVVQAVLVRPLSVPNADRLVIIKSTDGEWRARVPGGFNSVFSIFEVWRLDRADFEEMAAWSVFEPPMLTGAGGAERIVAPVVTSNFFSILGAAPALGRLFLPEDDRRGATPVVVLSHRFWVSRLGGDSLAIGRTITLDTTAYTVVGVTSPPFQSSPGPQTIADAWRGLGARLAGPGRRTRFGVEVVGRVRRGVTPERVANWVWKVQDLVALLDAKESAT